MNRKTLPTRGQLEDVKQMLQSGLYSYSGIVRKTGVGLIDVLTVASSLSNDNLPKQKQNSQAKPSMIDIVSLQAGQITPEMEALIIRTVKLAEFDWVQFCATPTGQDFLELLPDDTARKRASEIYKLGFCSRLTTFSDTGSDAFSPEEEIAIRERAWSEYIRNNVGKVILDGKPWPDTEREIAATAKLLFTIGFQSASLSLVGVGHDTLETEA